METHNRTPFLIAGLGNPGQAYRHNRHNVGFMVADRLSARMGIVFSRMESNALVTKGEYQGRRIVIAKPRTYMNLSGKAVGALARFYKVPLENLLVAYDDVDLPLGMLRIRPGGGSAGQKGMGSIIERLGTQDFPQDFSPTESEILGLTLEKAVDAILVFITEGLESAMNKFNPAVTE